MLNNVYDSLIQYHSNFIQVHIIVIINKHCKFTKKLTCNGIFNITSDCFNCKNITKIKIIHLITCNKKKKIKTKSVYILYLI